MWRGGEAGSYEIEAWVKGVSKKGGVTNIS